MKYIYYCEQCKKTYTRDFVEGEQPIIQTCNVCNDRIYLIDSMPRFRELEISLSKNDLFKKIETIVSQRKEDQDAISEYENDPENFLFAFEEKAKSVKITTTDLHEEYEIVAPVYFQINDAGIGSRLKKYIKKHKSEIESWKDKQQGSNDELSGFEIFGALINITQILSGEFEDRDLLGNGHAKFDIAFFIAMQELKLRAAYLGADAIVGMRQETNLDTNGFQHFYMQVYGTAVRTKKCSENFRKNSN